MEDNAQFGAGSAPGKEIAPDAARAPGAADIKRDQKIDLTQSLKMEAFPKLTSLPPLDLSRKIEAPPLHASPIVVTSVQPDPPLKIEPKPLACVDQRIAPPKIFITSPPPSKMADLISKLEPPILTDAIINREVPGIIPDPKKFPQLLARLDFHGDAKARRPTPPKRDYGMLSK